METTNFKENTSFDGAIYFIDEKITKFGKFTIGKNISSESVEEYLNIEDMVVYAIKKSNSNLIFISKEEYISNGGDDPKKNKENNKKEDKDRKKKMIHTVLISLTIPIIFIFSSIIIFPIVDKIIEFIMNYVSFNGGARGESDEGSYLLQGGVYTVLTRSIFIAMVYAIVCDFFDKGNRRVGMITSAITATLVAAIGSLLYIEEAGIINALLIFISLGVIPSAFVYLFHERY